MVTTINSAESNRAVLRYIPEVVWGSIPGSGRSRAMRITSSSLAASKETQQSQEIRADRMIPSIIEVAASTGGDVNFEASAGSQDDFYQQFLLMAGWTRAMNFFQVKGVTVAVTGTSAVTLAGRDWRDWLSNGQFIKLEGFLNPANNGYFAISAVNFTGGNTVITTVESTLVVEAGSPFTKCLDANDVLLKSTTTALEAANTINGGGANSFAGKQLLIGQRIYIEGLGKETAAVGFEHAPTEGDEFTVSDGVQSLTFEIRSNAGLVDPGHVHVPYAADLGVLRTNLIAAFADQFRRQKLRVTMASGVAGTKEAGSFEFATPAEVGDALEVSDGVNTVEFEFVATGAAGLLEVNIGASASESATNLAAKINAHPDLNVTATPAGATVNIVNDNYAGGSLTEVVDGGTDITTTDFTGGVAPTAALKNHRLTGGSISAASPAIQFGAFSGGDATKGGVFTIAALPNDDTIVVQEPLGVDANGGGLTVVIKGSHIRNPGDPDEIVKQSIAAETGFTDVNKYFRHTGLRVGTFSLSVAAGEIVTGSISFMGRETSPHDASLLADDAYTVMDTTSTEVLNATANVGNISKGGVPFTTAITAIEINGEANLREQRAVGSRFPAGIGYGRFSMTGTVTAYFQNFDLYNDFINHETVGLAFNFSDLDHNAYYWTIPAAKFTADPIAPEGVDSDVMEPLEWSAQRDPVLQTMLCIDRFSSLYPASAA